MHQYLWHAWVGYASTHDNSYNARSVHECVREARGTRVEYARSERRPICVQSARDAAIQCAWHLSTGFKEAYIWVSPVGADIEDAQLWRVRWSNMTTCTAVCLSDE